MRLSEIQTPALILDRNKLVSNIDAMTRHIASRGIRKLQERGSRVTVITDSLEVSRVLVSMETSSGPEPKALVEIEGLQIPGSLQVDPLL